MYVCTYVHTNYQVFGRSGSPTKILHDTVVITRQPRYRNQGRD
jgi:hypothetical protein